MRSSWLRAAILGFLIGPGPIVAEAADTDERSEEEARWAEQASGHVVRGSDFYVWDEDAREAQDWGAELAGASGGPAGWAGWHALAAASAARPSFLTAEYEDGIEAWLEACADGDADLLSLGFMLCLLPSLDRTCLISSWATSASEPTRRALARALAVPFEAVGVRGVLEHLQKDPSADVRRLARAAAASRGASLG